MLNVRGFTYWEKGEKTVWKSLFQSAVHSRQSAAKVLKIQGR